MKKIISVAALLTASLVFVEIKVSGGQGHGFPGLYALLGLAGGILLMIFAKALGHFLLYRGENYYEKN